MSTRVAKDQAHTKVIATHFGFPSGLLARLLTTNVTFFYQIFLNIATYVLLLLYLYILYVTFFNMFYVQLN